MEVQIKLFLQSPKGRLRKASLLKILAMLSVIVLANHLFSHQLVTVTLTGYEH